MTLHFNSDICEKCGLTLDEALILASLNPKNTEELYNHLVSEGLITKINNNLFTTWGKFALTPKGIEVINNIVLDSDSNISGYQNRIKELALKLRALYPLGKIPGTPYSYRGNTADIEKKLKSFFKRYGDNFTDEQIIEATKSYIDSFNGNYTYLKLLKYFIWKDERRDGEIIQSSLLADLIEGKNEGLLENNSDWTLNIR